VHGVARVACLITAVGLLAGCGGGGGVTKPNLSPLLFAPCNGTVDVQEGITVTIPLAVSDPESDPFTLSISGLPGATVTTTPVPQVVWTVTGSAGASYTATLTATDSHGHAKSVTFRVNVVRVEPPRPTPLSGPAPFGLGSPFLWLDASTAPTVFSDLHVKYVRNGAGASGALNWGQAYVQPDTFNITLQNAMITLPLGIKTLTNINEHNPVDQRSCPGIQSQASRYPCDPNSYLAWLRDGISKLKAVDPNYYFQIGNEPMNSGFWDDSNYNYARFCFITAKEIRQDCPTCTIALGGMTPSYLDSTLTYLDMVSADSGQGPGSRWYDVVDAHLFGVVKPIPDTRLHQPTYKDIATMLSDFRRSLAAHGASDKQIWVTETCTYTGSPVLPEAGIHLPAQTEEQQAADLVKRFVFDLANGVKVIIWPQLFDDPNYNAGNDTYFTHTGLINRDRTKKLSYYAYQKLASELVGVAWDSLRVVTTSASNVVTVSVPDAAGRKTFFVWWDYFLESGVSANATKSVSVRLTSGVDSVRVTTLVPNKSAGAQVNPLTDFASHFVRTTGLCAAVDVGRVPMMIEPWPPASMLPQQTAARTRQKLTPH
jgi:hypothetical protein